MSIILKTIFDLGYYEKPGIYSLKGILPRYVYDENNKKTNKIAGYKYNVVSLETYNSYSIFVPNKAPLMTPEELDELWEKGEKPLVEFKNPTIRAYFSSYTKSYEDSCKAEDVFLVDDNQKIDL